MVYDLESAMLPFSPPGWDRATGDLETSWRDPLALSPCFMGQSHLILVQTTGLGLEVLPCWSQTNTWLFCISPPLGQELAPVSLTAPQILQNSAPSSLCDFLKLIIYIYIYIFIEG